MLQKQVLQAAIEQWFHLQGASTADVRLQEDVRAGLGAGAGNVAAWKAANEYGLHQQPSDAPPVMRRGKTILGEPNIVYSWHATSSL